MTWVKDVIGDLWIYISQIVINLCDLKPTQPTAIAAADIRQTQHEQAARDAFHRSEIRTRPRSSRALVRDYVRLDYGANIHVHGERRLEFPQ